MTAQNDESGPAAGAPVERPVRPRAWLVEDPDPNGPRTFIATQDMEDAYSLATDEAPPMPLYDQAALNASVYIERERWKSAISVAAQATIHDYQASGDTDLDELVQRAMREICKRVGVDL